MGQEHHYDVITIGGGPAGAAISTLLAKAGRRVLLLEREVFPRFKVGESLIPASFDVLQQLGMIDKLRRSHFPRKASVQFWSGDGRASAPFYFSEADPGERSQTWQVLRSEFDTLMLENAREHGVEVVEGARVEEVLFEGERAVGVRAALPEDGRGSVRELTCRVVADATGQRSMLARKLGLKRPDPCLRMAGIFTHFEGGLRDDGIDEGATLILHTECQSSWFWYIPLPDDRVSVGVVGAVDALITGRQGNPERTFYEELERCPGLVPRLADARQLAPMRVLNDFSYTTSRAAGDGWVLVGDALGFLDPMYSSGVLLALRSAQFASECVVRALDADDPSAEQLGAFGPRFMAGMTSFKKLVYAFYTRGFSFGRFLRRYPEHRQPIIQILMGDVFDQDFSDLSRDLDESLRVMRLENETVTATVEAAAPLEVRV